MNLLYNLHISLIHFPQSKHDTTDSVHESKDKSVVGEVLRCCHEELHRKVCKKLLMCTKNSIWAESDK